jgi:hypothetical protein
MQRKFELGEIFVSPEVEELVARAGQDTEFFIEKHACGDWGEMPTALNEQGFRDKKIVVSVFRTLRRQMVWVFTNFEKNRTYVDCLRVSDSPSVPTVAHIPEDNLSGTDQVAYTVSYDPSPPTPASYDNASYPVLLANDNPTVTYTSMSPITHDDFTYTLCDGNGSCVPPVGFVVPPPAVGPESVEDVEEPDKEA